MKTLKSGKFSIKFSSSDVNPQEEFNLLNIPIISSRSEKHCLVQQAVVLWTATCRENILLKERSKWQDQCAQFPFLLYAFLNAKSKHGTAIKYIGNHSFIITAL